MPSLRQFLFKLRGLWRDRAREADMAEELRAHLERLVAANRDAGLSPDEARASARRQFGGLASIEERARDERRFRWLEHLGRDLRYAARQLRFNPGFASTAILSLALGIGANTAIVQLLSAVRLRQLPVTAPHELMAVTVDGGNRGWGVNPGWPNEATYPLWEQIRDHQQAFSGIFAWGAGDTEIGDADQKRTIRSLWVSGAAFPTLGVTPHRGRLFTDTDDRPACDRSIVVLSHGFWQRELGGRDSIVGSRLTVAGRPVTVLGVTPPEFFGLEVGSGFDVALPACTRWTQRRDLWWLGVMGRLKPGWTPARAAAHLHTASAALFEAAAPTGYAARSMETWRAFRLTTEPGSRGVSRLRSNYESSLWLLLGITGLVLLMACLNLANLLLARVAARDREMAVRAALGASRARLISQMLTESVMLSAIGAAVGLWLAGVLSRGLVRFLSSGPETIHLEVGLDWSVFGFTTLTALATTMVFGLLPATRSTRPQAPGALQAGARATGAGPRGAPFQRLLIASQVSLSLVLLAAALLFVWSYRNMATFDAGFRQDGILSVFLTIDHLRIPEDRRQRFKQDVTDAVKAIPHVDAAAMSTHVPLSGSGWSLGVRIPHGDGEQEGSSRFAWVGPGYFDTMQIARLGGRDFDARDVAGAGKVLIVNETFARMFLAGRPPIGATVRSVAEPGYPEATYEVVGLVRDTKYRNLREPIPALAFAPSEQLPNPGTVLRLMVRTSEARTEVIAAVRGALQRAVPGTAIDIDVLREQVLMRLVRERMLAWLSGVFGALAAVLALIGLYGVIAYMVARRRSEIGVRLAFGASRGSVLGLILGDVAVVVLVGIVVGGVLAVGLTRGARSLLFGIEPHDPFALALAGISVGLIALIAALLPAWRAARMDPLATLRGN
jgi:predicted permease